MNGFDFLFSLYSLLLGLAVAHVVTGFADSWIDRARTVLGASTLLLALLILLRAAGQWTSFWASRDGLSMRPEFVLICLGMALPYIFIGRIAFPRAEYRYAHTDDYYLENRRALLGALSIPPCISFMSNLGHLGTSLADLLWITLKFLLPLAIPVALIFSRRQIWHRMGLGILVVCTVVLIFLSK